MELCNDYRAAIDGRVMLTLEDIDLLNTALFYYREMPEDAMDAVEFPKMRERACVMEEQFNYIRKELTNV